MGLFARWLAALSGRRAPPAPVRGHAHDGAHARGVHAHDHAHGHGHDHDHPDGPASDAAVVGGLYAVPAGEGRRSVLKVLALDDGGVHVRTYATTYPGVPARIDAADLMPMIDADALAAILGAPEPSGDADAAAPDDESGPFDAGDDAPLPIGHLPLSHATFAAWGATFVQATAVDEAELDGYRRWREAGGTYF